MNIPAILRVFALFLLPAFFAVLLAGCGGQTIAVYDPIGESPADLRSAKILCKGETTTQMAPIVAQQQALAAQRQAEAAKARAAEAQARALRELSSRFAQPSPQSAFSGVDFGGFAASFAAAESEKRVFCGCMAKHGWACGGEIMPHFFDINNPTVMPADSGNTPLHAVAGRNNYDTVERLILDDGADVNVKNDGGQTPLHFAIWKNAVKSAEVLLNNGADANMRSGDGATPLQIAALYGSHDIAALLIRRGADINAVDGDDWASLHSAARYNTYKVAALLISEGADIEAQGGDDGLTPLHRAAFYGSVETAGLLIARGADPNAKTYADETPLDIAKQEGKRDIIAMLERAARKAESVDGEPDSTDGGDGAESVFENAWRSVVVVVAGDNQGGGVVVNGPNQVATNCHVVDESPSDIRVYKGENRRAVRGRALFRRGCFGGPRAGCLHSVRLRACGRFRRKSVPPRSWKSARRFMRLERRRDWIFPSATGLFRSCARAKTEKPRSSKPARRFRRGRPAGDCLIRRAGWSG